jgi:hypothetical protein
MRTGTRGLVLAAALFGLLSARAPGAGEKILAPGEVRTLTEAELRVPAELLSTPPGMLAGLMDRDFPGAYPAEGDAQGQLRWRVWSRRHGELVDWVRAHPGVAAWMEGDPDRARFALENPGAATFVLHHQEIQEWEDAFPAEAEAGRQFRAGHPQAPRWDAQAEGKEVPQVRVPEVVVRAPIAGGPRTGEVPVHVTSTGVVVSKPTGSGTMVSPPAGPVVIARPAPPGTVIVQELPPPRVVVVEEYPRTVVVRPPPVVVYRPRPSIVVRFPFPRWDWHRHGRRYPHGGRGHRR